MRTYQARPSANRRVVSRSLVHSFTPSLLHSPHQHRSLRASLPPREGALLSTAYADVAPFTRSRCSAALACGSSGGGARAPRSTYRRTLRVERLRQIGAVAENRREHHVDCRLAGRRSPRRRRPWSRLPRSWLWRTGTRQRPSGQRSPRSPNSPNIPNSPSGPKVRRRRLAHRSHRSH